MPACCTPFERVADQQFNRDTAAAELKRYRRKGPGATTRLLADGIAQADALGSTLLDIGSGIGVLTFTLLARGVAHATAVDASSAFIELGQQEANRLGRADAVHFLHADFVSVAPELSNATVVALDRVVCCYPSYEPLLAAALRRTDRCLALSYPRDTWYVRAATLMENRQRWLMRNAFRTFVHPSERIEQLIRRAWFTLHSRRETWTWSVDVYTR